MKSKATTVPVSERALKQRISRALVAQGQALRASRGAASAELGEYFIVDTHTNRVEASHVELEKLGKEIGALKPYEKLAR